MISGTRICLGAMQSKGISLFPGLYGKIVKKAKDVKKKQNNFEIVKTIYTFVAQSLLFKMGGGDYT